MKRYHISASGKPAVCTAKLNNCPLGGENEHFSSAIEATEHYEKKSFEIFNATSSTSKITSDINDSEIESLNNMKESFK